MLFFIFTFYSYPVSIGYKVSIINSVIFLFELELKQFKLSKILPMLKIGVYMVSIMNNKHILRHKYR